MKKYRNKPTIRDGIWFQSIGEADRYSELKYLLLAGKIRRLRLQVRIILVPADKKREIRALSYIADFVYYDNDIKRIVIEDAKGCQTALFKAKWKILQASKYAKRCKLLITPTNKKESKRWNQTQLKNYLNRK